MKKIFVTLLIAFAVVFTSACGGNQSAFNNSRTEEKRTAKNNKGSKDFKSYLSNYDKNAEEFLADFDFNQYLLDSGAIEIKRLEDRYDSEMIIATRYPNNIIVEYMFSSNRSNPYSYGYLDNVCIFVAEEGFDLDGNYTGSTPEDELGIKSDWNHYYAAYSAIEFTNDSSYEDKHDFGKYFMVKPEKIYYIRGSDGQKNFLTVPQYFEDGFKASILPYIELKDPSYRQDPMQGQVMGYTAQ